MTNLIWHRPISKKCYLSHEETDFFDQLNYVNDITPQLSISHRPPTASSAAASPLLLLLPLIEKMRLQLLDPSHLLSSSSLLDTSLGQV
jgi:hypothetical protein